MRYVPRLPAENVNVSRTSLFKEFIFLVSVILSGIVLIYLLLGFAVNLVVEKLPPKYEQSLENIFVAKYESKGIKKNVYIQNLVDDIKKFLPFPYSQKNYRVLIVKDKMANAFALPGNIIIITSGLLKEVKSENELTMILAHEIGHIVHRDHLKVLGRRLVLGVLFSIIFGNDSAVSSQMNQIISTVDLKFSRKQETQADLFAVDILYKKYGHVGGALDFFKRCKEKSKLPSFTNFLLTHPLPEKRIRILEETIQEKNYPIRPTIPLHINL
jgi:Zn-dependent protease with chaperone function